MLWGRKVWRTVDAAIRDAVPVDAGAPAINYEQDRTDGSSEARDLVLGARAVVLAALAKFTEDEQTLLVHYAHGFSYARIAKAMRMRKGSAILRHRQAWRALAARLVKAEVVERER